MSEQFPPPPPGGPQFQPAPQGQFPPQPGPFQPGGYGDAKAAAKAAKAYAKAQRPWFKKKRWILGGALAVIVVISALAGGGGSGDTTAKESASDTSSDTGAAAEEKGEVTPVDDASKAPEKSEPAEQAKVGTRKNPAPPGTAVANKSARYTVDKVEVTDSLGQFVDPPSGAYVVVTLTVENVKDKTIQVSSEDYRLEVAGTEIEPSSNAYILDDAFSFDDLSPGLKRTGRIAFDVAADNAGKGVLKAQAVLSMDKPVYLSLK